MYTIKFNGLYYELLDAHNRLVSTADTLKEAEAEELVLLKESANNVTRDYLVTYLQGRAKWVTRNGLRFQVLLEDPKPNSSLVTATCQNDAINKVKTTGYIYSDIQVV